MSDHDDAIEGQIHDLRQRVRSKEDFLRILSLIQDDLRINGEQWENSTLESYLQAMEAWVFSMENYYARFEPAVDLECPGWAVFVDILLAARVYE